MLMVLDVSWELKTKKQYIVRYSYWRRRNRGRSIIKKSDNFVKHSDGMFVVLVLQLPECISHFWTCLRQFCWNKRRKMSTRRKKKWHGVMTQRSMKPVRRTNWRSRSLLTLQTLGIYQRSISDKSWYRSVSIQRLKKSPNWYERLLIDFICMVISTDKIYVIIDWRQSWTSSTMKLSITKSTWVLLKVWPSV